MKRYSTRVSVRQVEEQHSETKRLVKRKKENRNNVHCVVVLLFLTILPGLEVIGIVCLLRFLESSSSSVRLLAHPPTDVHSHAVLAVDSDRFLDPSIDSGWGTVEEHNFLDEGGVEDRSEFLNQMEEWLPSIRQEK